MELARSKPAVEGAFPQGSAVSQTLGRGLDVLEQVAAGPVALGVIASRLGLSRSTVHRLATSLLERRYLNLAPRRGYSLGPKLLELGSVAQGQIGLVRAARPVMEMLAEATGDAVLLAVRDGHEAVLVGSVPGTRRLAPRLRIGERHDLVQGAPGYALLMDASDEELAGLFGRPGTRDAAGFVGKMMQARQAGIVIDAAEADPEIGMMAAPVRGADGTIRGALGIATASSYREAGLSPAARAALRRAADAVSQELGWQITNMHDAAPDAEAERELLGIGAGFGKGSGVGAFSAARRVADGPAAGAQDSALRADGPGTAEDELLSDDDGMKGRGA